MRMRTILDATRCVPTSIRHIPMFRERGQRGLNGFANGKWKVEIEVIFWSYEPKLHWGSYIGDYTTELLNEFT